MGAFQFHHAVLFLKESGHPLSCHGSPILQLGWMGFILGGNLRQRLIFFQEFLNHSRFERG